MKTAIVCDWFLTRDGAKLRAGGTEAFVQRLLTLLERLGLDATIFQRGDERFQKRFRGAPILAWRNFRELRELTDSFLARGGRGAIYSDVHVVPEKSVHPAILIQHGVYWDVPYRRFRNPLVQGALNWKKDWDHSRLAARLMKLCKRMDRVVTVDTNFQNWLRERCSWNVIEDRFALEDRFAYVPNCTSIHDSGGIAQKLAGGRPIQRVLFARRFDVFRGTFSWGRVVRRLAPRYPDVQFVFCGHGGDNGLAREHELRDLLAGLPNVATYERPWELMPDEHFAADIEVVPSLGSEGTSYSLVEALGAGACAICTTVGGLANVVLPTYNGLMVQATERAMEAAAVSLLENPVWTRELARRGYETAQTCFSVAAWEARMERVIMEAFAGE
ncbi:MAG: glycosyltransferase family 4 protein [Bryobacteraceae bacterium]|jgi:glycosyltransferase involved in cell wall biosynthesis